MFDARGRLALCVEIRAGMNGYFTSTVEGAMVGLMVYSVLCYVAGFLSGLLVRGWRAFWGTYFASGRGGPGSSAKGKGGVQP